MKLAAGALTQQGADEDLKVLERRELDLESAQRAGQAFPEQRAGVKEPPVLLDFFTRADPVRQVVSKAKGRYGAVLLQNL